MISKFFSASVNSSRLLASSLSQAPYLSFQCVSLKASPENIYRQTFIRKFSGANSTENSMNETSKPKDTILRELCYDQQVVRLVLNAEKSCNLLTLELMDILIKELREIDKIPKLRAVILAARGRAFSAGHNLKELTSETGNTHKLIFKRASELMLLIHSMKLPVIAEVDGVVAAAGCQLVSSCDIVVASQKSKFMVNGIKSGLLCSTPGIPLSRNIPRKLVLDMLLTGRAITAQEAYQAGLVSRLVSESDSVEVEALKVAESILEVSRSVTALGKAFFYSHLDVNNLHVAYRHGEAVMCENLKYVDAQNGINAFIKKTKPEWTHTDEKVV